MFQMVISKIKSELQLLRLSLSCELNSGMLVRYFVWSCLLVVIFTSANKMDDYYVTTIKKRKDQQDDYLRLVIYHVSLNKVIH